MSTRLSPAASLLRNSKLFALPAQIPLPASLPSAEPVASSDTATSVYPQYASIATPRSSGMQGDWGLKRPLPTKAATKTNNPYIRLMRGIDSKEHVADFESAADHTLTLRKFQELNQLIVHEVSAAATGPNTVYGGFATKAGDYSVFKSTSDNTTNLGKNSPAYTKASGTWPEISPEQMTKGMPDLIAKRLARVEALKAAERAAAGIDPLAIQEAERATAEMAEAAKKVKPTRWRYAGPSLTQMTGAEFDEYLFNLGDKERAKLRLVVLEKIRDDRAHNAREAGTMDSFDKDAPVTDEDFKHTMRRLRATPEVLGPILTNILDIPEGGTPAKKGDFAYGRETLATLSWKRTGPPRTHPSAGLSYLNSQWWAENHHKHGPQSTRKAVTGRFLKNRNDKMDIGVAGFVAKDKSVSATGGLRNYQRDDNLHPAGQSFPVEVEPSFVNNVGAIQLQIKSATEGIWEQRGGEVAYALDVQVEEEKKGLEKIEKYGGTGAMPRLEQSGGRASVMHRRNIPAEGLSPAEVLDLGRQRSRASLASRNVEL